ncbi:MAG: ABC transporter ATP-binding protein [Gemmatimonadota bacterium]
MIELEGVSKSYREGERLRPVLESTDARVEEGEWVALLGPSGSGKTTVLNLISGIDRPDAGRVRVAGVDLTGLGERERTLFRRRSIGFVFQSFNLLPTLTVEENLLLPLELNRLDSSGRRAEVMHILDEVGLGDRRSAYPDRLSTGERQRVAIARALAHDPPIILADEPTGNLDAETGAHVMELMDRLLHRRGKTMLTVTHSEALASRADRIMELRNRSLLSRS